MFLALRGCEAGHWASWLLFPARRKPKHTLIHSTLGLVFSNAVRNEIHSLNQKVWREKPVKGKAVLGTESRECFHESFVLGGEEPSMAEHSLTSGCWPRGEVSVGDLICFPLGSLCECFWKEMSSARGRVELDGAALRVSSSIG